MEGSYPKAIMTGAEKALPSNLSQSSQSCFFWDKIAHAKSVGYSFWFYSAI